MTYRASTLMLAALLASGALGACRSKVEPEPVPSVVETRSSASVTTSSVRSTESIEQARRDSIAARRRADSIATSTRTTTSVTTTTNTVVDTRAVAAELASVLQGRVYFDYDRDNLRDDAVAALDAKAAILLANPSVSVSIMGHTDERGTAEYNLALGQRRAAQVKRYLVAKGISDGRLATQSLGDSQPAVQGTDESSYQQNRRAEFEVNGTATVRPQS
jgi:peptidoglycan-associated lipoprotein